MRAFVVLGLVFFHTKPRDWLGERLQNELLLCRIGRKTQLPAKCDVSVKVFKMLFKIH